MLSLFNFKSRYMEVSDELKEAIFYEIARLSMETLNQHDIGYARGMSMIINHLCAVAVGQQSISDFHEEISGCPEAVREYYYRFLYQIK